MMQLRKGYYSKISYSRRSQPMEIELVPNSKQAVSSQQPLSGEAIHFNSLSEQQLSRCRQIEGQCRIKEWQYLKVNYPKGIFFGIIMTLTIIGLLFIKYYRSLRAILFYTKLEEHELGEATDIYVQSEDKLEQICDMMDLELDSVRAKSFQFKHLKYELIAHHPVPLVLHYALCLDSHLQPQFLASGIGKEEEKKRQNFYGRNEHRVEVPTYPQFLFDTMTQPFFIFQYFVSAVYILEGLTLFGVLMVIFSWLTTTINYILLRRSYNKIKETAEKEYPVRVLRNGTFYNIKNIDLVPGDLYVPAGEVPCDSVIVQGELFVDQASLTGENVPIAKFKLLQTGDVDKSEHWIYEGSMVETVKEGTLALAIHVGYASKRGRIIRKILTKVASPPDFFKKLIFFMIETFVVILIVYAATLPLLLSINIETIMVVFRFLDYITYAFPAPFPIYFNLLYSFCLVRLHRDGIIGTEVEKTVASGRLKTMCFDKTGTLTQAAMEVRGVFGVREQQDGLEDISDRVESNSLISGVFGCCNSVQVINGEVKGDEIDLRLFLLSKGEIQKSESQGVVRSVALERETWDVLRINQYESKFQSMSVLVQSRETKRIFILVKGSPEKIHLNSTNKISNYDQFIQKLSLQGYRSIAFGCRQVQQGEVSSLMTLDRSEYLRNTRILGVVTFINLVKTDARQTIDILAACNISTKIITGDNIFLGIQTAFMTGMIPENASVAVLQGRSYSPETGRLQLLTLSRNGKGFTELRQTVQNFVFESQANLYYAIDNDFLKVRSEFLHHSVKVFARITPENKALIVKKHKEIYTEEVSNRSVAQKIFGDCGFKVGIVGDGANDLIAIKEADVGIGIASSDAVYSASFTVSDLLQIDEVIREAKNTERQVVDVAQFYGVAQFLSLPVILILTRDASYPSSMMLIYRNFAAMLIIPLLYGLSRPAQRLTRYLTNTNFMGLEHHLVFWGNALIATAGLVGAYQYFSNTSGFIPNPNPAVTFENGYNGNTHGATILFITMIPIFIFMGIFVFRSHPWKERFYQNKALFVVLLLNFIAMFFLFFGTQHLSFLDVVPIVQKQAAICLAIMLATMAVLGIFNLVIEKLAFHEKQTQLEQNYEAMGTEHLSGGQKSH